MYTLLIADDEPLECDAIELLVTRANLPLRVIKARNGFEAVELAEQCNPHIAFLDIRMPGMNGIEAAKHIRQQIAECQIVFLTAWSTFESAQQAIRLRACEYLVKPVQHKEVYDLLDRLIGNLDRQYESEKQQTQEIREVLNLFSQEFFAALKFGKVSQEALGSYLTMQGITSQEGTALVIRGLAEDKVQQFFQQGRIWGKPQICYFPSTDRITILMFTSHSVKLIEQIAGNRDEYDVVIGSGIPFSSLNQIPNSIATATVAFTYATRQNIRLQRFTIALTPQKDSKQNHHLMLKILQAIDQGQSNIACSLAHELIDTINNTEVNEAQCAEELFQLITVFSYELNKKIPLLKLDAIPKSSLIEQEFYLLSIIKTVCDATERDRRDRYERPFAFVKQYLQEHMNQQLSVEDVARLININSKYFSQLCKVYLGSTFVEYLTKIRMEKAYTLLLEGSSTVKEVAEATGFSDGNYFSRVFRQYHNISPSLLKGNPLVQE